MKEEESIECCSQGYTQTDCIYIYEGQIWTTNVYVNEWSQLEDHVDCSLGSSPKFIVPRSLMALGGSRGAIGLSMAHTAFQRLEEVLKVTLTILPIMNI